jgi:uncharacterized protein YndB with AHSA1/START domain
MPQMTIAPFLISRAYDVPRDRLWRAWTEVDQMKQWWGPKGFTVSHLTMDLRPGGKVHYCLQMPGGAGELWGRMIYREIVKPERIVWVNAFSNKDGGLGVHPMAPDWPREMLTTARFASLGERKSSVTIEWMPLEGSSEVEFRTFDQGRDSMKGGWTGTFDQLQSYLN